MRRVSRLLTIVLIIVFISINVYAVEEVLTVNDEQENSINTVDVNSREYILSLVTAVEIDAVVNRDCKIYSDYSLKKLFKTVSKGENVKYLRDKNEKSANIRLQDGKTGWIAYTFLDISELDYTTEQPITDQQKVLYINYKEYKSDTDYLVWVNVERQQVNVFKTEMVTGSL